MSAIGPRRYFPFNFLFYIANQEEHHRKLTFREEFICLLDQAGIAYDSKWLD